VTVSVLLPVYNAGATLRRAIESILTQDYGDFEFVIIDDGSSDNSPSILRGYAAQDLRIRAVYHDVNLGLPITLNEGLRTATHDLVVRMDADDESLPNRLRVQLDFMHAHPEIVVAGSFVYHVGATRRHDRLATFLTDPSEIRERLPRENTLYHSSVIMRREEILGLGGYRDEFKTCEDYDLWLRASKRHELAVIPEPLLRYRFSVHGWSRVRVWEHQLFFAYLAQAANENDGRQLEDAWRIAEEKLAETDRESFLVLSSRWMIVEFGLLHLWRDAAIVVARLVRDVGPRAAPPVLRLFVRAWVRSALRVQRLRLASVRKYLASC
jgi:glycosyltransferase involved in cell wall biosynthesis